MIDELKKLDPADLITILELAYEFSLLSRVYIGEALDINNDEVYRIRKILHELLSPSGGD